MVNGISESIRAYSCNFQHEAIYVATKVKWPGWQLGALQPKSLQTPLIYPRNSNNYATTHCIGATDKRRWRTFVLPLPAVDIFSLWKNLAPVRTVTALSSKRSASLLLKVIVKVIFYFVKGTSVSSRKTTQFARRLFDQSQVLVPQTWHVRNTTNCIIT